MIQAVLFFQGRGIALFTVGQGFENQYKGDSTIRSRRGSNTKVKVQVGKVSKRGKVGRGGALLVYLCVVLNTRYLGFVTFTPINI